VFLSNFDAFLVPFNPFFKGMGIWGSLPGAKQKINWQSWMTAKHQKIWCITRSLVWGSVIGEGELWQMVWPPTLLCLG
jgi:hypothetical protein